MGIECIKLLYMCQQWYSMYDVLLCSLCTYLAVPSGAVFSTCCQAPKSNSSLGAPSKQINEAHYLYLELLVTVDGYYRAEPLLTPSTVSVCFLWKYKAQCDFTKMWTCMSRTSRYWLQLCLRYTMSIVQFMQSTIDNFTAYSLSVHVVLCH